ncbi:MAG: phosphatidate cytidylyltransferase [Gemmatimonadetes bacterium]|nr:phosphatidate cytidylyltransferase [Gemmatimonadota bacterium]
MSSNLSKRLAVAGVGIPICAAVTYMGGYEFAFGLGIVAAIGYWEYATMMRGAGVPAFRALGAIAAFFYPPVVLIGQFHGAALYSGGLLMGFAAVAMAHIPIEEKPIRSAAVTAFGVLYVGGLLAFAVPIREGWFMLDPEFAQTTDRISRTLFLFFPLVITWIADMAAYFGGKALGRQKLAPVVSPNKTVAGAVSALVAAVVVAAAYSRLVLPGAWALDWVPTILFGFTVGALAIFGDLVESALKRECGVKDSSNLLPGHGGMLDRLDSVLWALPAAFFFMAIFK